MWDTEMHRRMVIDRTVLLPTAVVHFASRHLFSPLVVATVAGAREMHCLVTAWLPALAFDDEVIDKTLCTLTHNTAAAAQIFRYLRVTLQGQQAKKKEVPCHFSLTVTGFPPT